MGPRPKESRVNTHRIFMVDDHPVLRRGVGLVINDEPDMEVCGEAETVEQAMAAIKKARPDAVLIDISLKDSSGLDLVESLKTTQPDLPTLVLSAHSAERYAERALRAGARGYVTKEDKIEVVIAALRQVLAGEIYVNQDVAPGILAHLFGGKTEHPSSPPDLLSNREIEVFNMLGQGVRTSKIAENLHLSPKTIQVYRENIKKKLGLADAVQLHQAAFEWVRDEEPV